MKKIKSNIQTFSLAFLLLWTFVACNKEVDATKVISVELKGFNIGDAELEISIDTVVFSKEKVSPNMELNFAKVYAYPSSQKEISLKIKDINSGKEVYNQPLDLNNNELEKFFQFIWIDGKQLEVKPPAADPATNKIGFYIHYPQSNDPIDIFMQNDEGQIAYLARNVQPSTWLYSDYLTSEGFKNPNANYNIYFTKAGTTDTWAFAENQWMSTAYANGIFLPQDGQTGKVCSIFVTPGTVDLRAVRLFKRPR
ncbi:MAG: hypothetical protein J7578_08320 [Chitinophagaceae bacterium]|nr:hypothetical protein [Chitinophagaceae bacterium]